MVVEAVTELDGNGGNRVDCRTDNDSPRLRTWGKLGARGPTCRAIVMGEG